MNTGSWLAGLRVVDLTSNIAGPTVSRMFGEIGADVIKVEPPWGEDARNSTTPYLGREGALHLAVNRNKRGIAINLRRPEGREIMRKLLATADVFVENTAPGSLDRFELDYESVKSLNPKLVYVSITGWGQEGPITSFVGYGLAAAAYGGLVIERQGEPPELRGGMADPTAALLAGWATMVALRERDRTGQGSHVTTSLLQGALFLSAMGFAMPEVERDARVAGLPGGGPLGATGSFRTADDKWIYLNIWSQEQFERIFELAGLPEIGRSETFKGRANRQAHAAELNEILGSWVASQNSDELFELLQRESLPSAPIHPHVSDLINDAQVQANHVLQVVPHPTKGDVWQLGATFEVDGVRPAGTAAPLLGQHTREIMAELGYTDSEIAELLSNEVVTMDALPQE